MDIVGMLDAVRVNAHNIPAGTPRVAGYVTGSGVVPWTAAQWDLFPPEARVRIDQSPSLSVFRLGGADVADVEPFAGTVASFVQAVEDRIRDGANGGWSTIYGTSDTIAAARDALDRLYPRTPTWYYGHVDCWLADWNLDEQHAAAVIGELVHGLSCRAVQWASPTSNPRTPVPGSDLTLEQAQLDLSAADSDWPKR